MNITDAINTRYSVRGYLPDPLPEELVTEIFEQARLAPSNTNCQPWHVAIASGEIKKRLAEALCERFDARDPGEPDFPYPTERVADVYMERRRACGYSYYATMGVERSDRAGRALIARKNFELFEAPHAAFFSMPQMMGHSNAVDLGIFLQTVMLLMTERGIGCIAQGALATYPDTVKDFLPIPEENGILFGLSFGYEDRDALINTVRMPREPLSVIASFSS